MKVCIGGCAKSCAQWLPAVLDNIRLIIKTVNLTDIDVYVSYDDSEDDTLRILEEAKDIPIHILRGSNPGICRQHRLAIARNRILDVVKDVDYLIMMDMDGICAGEMDVQVLKEVFRRTSEWDAVSFNRVPYYDYWALSLGDFQFSVWHHKYPRALLTHFKSALATALNSPDDMIDVDSAFGGFAIYKWSVFQCYRYESLIDLRLFNAEKIARVTKTFRSPIMPRIFHDCEHRSFHIRAKHNGARIKLFKAPLFA